MKRRFHRLNDNELAMIDAVAARMQSDVAFDFTSARMLTMAVHCINPLRLSDLLMADDLNFAHDAVGMMNNYDPIKGVLKDCWTPRFSV